VVVRSPAEIDTDEGGDAVAGVATEAAIGAVAGIETKMGCSAIGGSTDEVGADKVLLQLQLLWWRELGRLLL